MCTLYPDPVQEHAASAAQVRDLSAQVQAIQAQLTLLQDRRRGSRRVRGTLLYGGVLALVLGALVASVLHPLRQNTRTVVRVVTQVHVVHEVRTVPVVRVVVATPVRPAGTGVLVCAAGDFALAAAVCQRPATTLTRADVADARLSYTGRGGGTFGATQVTIALAERNDGGSVSTLGRISVGVLVSSTSQASRLQGVFDALGVTPRSGRLYLIEVDAGNTNLGVTRFLVTGS